VTALIPTPPSDNSSSDRTLNDQMKALERANRILKKKLTRSEQTRAEIEETSQYQERMLQAALKRAEKDGAELAAAQEELLRLNKELEDRIEVRTAALDKATNSLEQAKVQVVKSEKFSALGELVAGVAHEINNPIGCITSNINFVREYGAQLMQHIEVLDTVLSEHRALISDQALEKVSESAEDIELEYIAEDFPKLVESIETSGERITAISQSLRTFARADTTQKQAYNIHQGIDGTLLILRHRLKAVGDRAAITITKSYGEIPTIHCYPGQINQVFMNILANAIDAMDEGYKSLDNRREISITTKVANLGAANLGDTNRENTDPKETDQQLIVNITDTAGGIPQSVIERIFESQFTTKKAGKGTGLGLSIAHDIITKDHSGEIVCTSDIGSGTTFLITLPID